MSGIPWKSIFRFDAILAGEHIPCRAQQTGVYSLSNVLHFSTGIEKFLAKRTSRNIVSTKISPIRKTFNTRMKILLDHIDN